MNPNDEGKKKEPAELPSDLLHDSGEAGGDSDSHLGASRDHEPRAEDDGPDTAKLQRTPGQDAGDRDSSATRKDNSGVVPS